MASMSPSELLTAWEEAYLSQCQAARVGRLFKGTIHNLNGVVQAFSMQSELFAMMFNKADILLNEALAASDNDQVREKITQTIDLLQKRQRTLGQVEEKILLSQEILKNNEDICQQTVNGSTITLSSLVNNVVNFFCSHMFFKHKVTKKINVEAEIALGSNAFALSVILANLIENSIEAMEQQSQQEACFALRCFSSDNKIIIEIEDNGIGVPEHIQGVLFDEFVSATPGHQGLGLYLVRKLLANMGGEIKIAGLADPTVFAVSLPINFEKV